jgi:hypothetical protein
MVRRGLRWFSEESCAPNFKDELVQSDQGKEYQEQLLGEGIARQYEVVKARSLRPWR